MKRPPTTRDTVPIALLVLCCAVWFLVITYPLVLNPAHCFICPTAMGGNDGFVFPWNAYVFRESVLHGRWPFHTDLTFFPTGANLLVHLNTLPFGIVDLVVRNPLLAINLAVFASVLVSAVGAFLLCREYVGSRSLCMLAGFTYAFCTPVLGRLCLGQYNLVLTAGIPFFLWAFTRAFPAPEEPRLPGLRSRRYLWGALASLAVLAASDPCYTLYALMFAAFYAVYFPLSGSATAARLWRARWWLAIPTIVACTAAVVVQRRLHLPDYGALTGVADLNVALLPSGLNPILGGLIPSSWRAPRLSTLCGTPVPYTLLLPAAGYLVTRGYRRDAAPLRGLWFSLVLLTLFSMPVVRYSGRALFALPSALFYFFPPLAHAREPARLQGVTMLLLAVFAMVFIERRVAARVPPRWHILVPALLWTLALVEHLPAPFPIQSDAVIPRVHRHLATLPPGVLLEIPFGMRTGYDLMGRIETAQMYYQSVHGKKMIGGMVARMPYRQMEWFRRQPVVGPLLSLLEAPKTRVHPAAPAEVDAFLERFQVRYVILWPEYRNSPAADYLVAAIGRYVRTDQELDGYRLLTLAPPGPSPSRR